MSYVPHNFKDGDVLFADQLNDIDRQIQKNEEDIANIHVTTNTYSPDMFGAIGDGIHDDAPALIEALESGHPVVLNKDLWIFSPVKITNHNVYLNGNGYTIHADMNNVMVDEGGNNIYDVVIFMALPTDSDDAPLRMVYDTETVYISDLIGIPRTEGAEFSENYQIGYMSFNGHNPLPQRYRDMMHPETTVERKFPYMRVVMNDVHFRLNRCRGRNGLAFNYLCDCDVRNVSVIAEDGEGNVGLSVGGCYNFALDHIRCENFWAEYTWMTPEYDPVYGRGNGGYGILLAGDSIFLNNYLGWNNKSNLTIAGSRTVWTTNLAVNGMHVGFDVDPNNMYRYSLDGTLSTIRYGSAFNAHEDAICPVISNVTIDIYNANISSLPFNIRCPEAVLSNIAVNSEAGTVYSAGLNEMLWLDNISAPTCVLSVGWANISGYAGSNFVVRQVVARGCHFFRVENGAAQAIVKLDDCFIEQYVWDVQHLVMNNTTIYGRYPSGPYDFIPLKCLEEAQITGCQIYHNRAEYRSVNTPIIQAPSDTVWMVNTWLYKPLNVTTLKKNTTQTHWSNVREIDLWGMILDDFEFGLLDKGNLM